MLQRNILINRAPVLTLWAAVVAERLGFQPDEALSLGKAVSGLTAQTKGRRLGIFTPSPESTPQVRERKCGEEFWVELCGQPVPAINTPKGVRAVNKDQPIDPASVQRYLESKFGDELSPARESMVGLASAFTPEELAREAFRLYEQFRPSIPEGVSGWGTKGELNLERIRSLATK
jgi:hypothetical protein